MTEQERKILSDFYQEVCAEAERTITATGMVSGAHWNAMQVVLKRKGVGERGMKPIFGETVPSLPFTEAETVSLCPVCGREPVGVSCGGVTWVACQHCGVTTAECDDPEDAWDLWEAGDVQPCANS